MTSFLLLLAAVVLPCAAMDMDMGGGGTPWLDTPVMLHSSREDSCEMTAEQCAYRSGFWRYWYKADYRFARTTVYFILAVIGLFTIGNIVSRVTPQSVRRKGFWRQTQASLRYVGYRAYRVRVFDWYSPSLAYLLVGLAGAVFFFAMTLGPQPYYWPNTKDGSVSYGSSPPIATRTGWMAVGLLPFVVVLAAKANWVTALTGVSHEKLQVFHRWTSYAMFVLALVHTFPFIIYHIWYGDMVKKWKTDMVYWTGVVALIFQTYLTVMSFGPIRNRFYEFFKATHFTAALAFIIFFFFHCDFRLTSWDYFIATATLYLSSLAFARLRAALARGSAHRARLAPLPNAHLAISVRLRPADVARQAVPVDFVWRPGQHVFLRFFSSFSPSSSMSSGLGWWSWLSWSGHPFTICSLPPLSASYGDETMSSSSPPTTRVEVGKTGEKMTMTTTATTATTAMVVPDDFNGDPVLRFVVKPQAAGGVTARLYEMALEGAGGAAEVGVMLDGPYGGVRPGRAAGGGGGAPGSDDRVARSRLAGFDRVLVVVGGSGAGFSMPVVEEALRVSTSSSRTGKGGDDVRKREVSVVLATRDGRTRAWYSAEMRALLERYGVCAGGDGHIAVKVAVHVTGEAEADEEAGVETAAEEKRDDGVVAWRRGRPQLRTVVEEYAAEAKGLAVAVAVCGPAGMLYDVRNAVAEVQKGVLSGKGASEVYLHTEHFS
ncbi:ferric-chelate reductase [Diplodia corticola]|uniref:Ferric-chelate reductase n=1 Tax=Diplodia corticola TaxID=236234 RepID=A0A1J9S1A4_9PEZI|nr:ferric-chelate reductase [Diplodia corticola]OJD33804.1 ferric-chelate reductase [Diplodia corticola]